MPIPTSFNKLTCAEGSPAHQEVTGFHVHLHKHLEAIHQKPHKISIKCKAFISQSLIEQVDLRAIQNSA